MLLLLGDKKALILSSGGLLLAKFVFGSPKLLGEIDYWCQLRFFLIFNYNLDNVCNNHMHFLDG